MGKYAAWIWGGAALIFVLLLLVAAIADPPSDGSTADVDLVNNSDPVSASDIPQDFRKVQDPGQVARAAE